MTIGFNSKYLLDIASEVEDQNLVLNLKDSTSPVLIQDKSDISKFTLSFNRRAYNFEIYSIPDRGLTGANFNIFGLGYDGYGRRFKDNF